MNIIPDGYFGYWINLDQPGLWCYFDYEMYRFGVIIKNEQTGGYENWTPVAGVNELSDDGGYYYRYIFKIPDEEVDVGDKFTPIYYDGTDGWEFDPYMEEQYPVATITIGEPYMPLDELEYESAFFSLLYKNFDKNGDGCLTQDEMWGFVEWSMQDDSMFEQ